MFQELRAVNDLYRLGYTLYYWRIANGLEVDFVLYGEKGFIAIEVKRAAKIRNQDFKGLKAFSREYPEAAMCMFYGGDKKLFVNNIKLIPIVEAITTLSDLLAGGG